MFHSLHLITKTQPLHKEDFEKKLLEELSFCENNSIKL